jgi:hypothetical protein
LTVDLLFRSLSSNLLDTNTTPSLHASVAASDPSEAQIFTAQSFMETLYGDPSAPSRASSRAATPMRVRPPSLFSFLPFHASSLGLYPRIYGLSPGSSGCSFGNRFTSPGGSPKSIRLVTVQPKARESVSPSKVPGHIVPSYMISTASQLSKNQAKSQPKGESIPPPTPRRLPIHRPSVLPTLPCIDSVTVQCDPSAEYAILISMYEVYNDRIFDLLVPPSREKATKDFRRRPLLFKPTEHSPDRKVVAGLRKVICNNTREALMILEAGLNERRVAGTGSNSVSSRSHGFFSIEVKKRRKTREGKDVRGLVPAAQWGGSALTIVDLAGSERARDAKTAGATLAEAGKINESLMYLGQCLQMQSDAGNGTKVSFSPYFSLFLPIFMDGVSRR